MIVAKVALESANYSFDTLFSFALKPEHSFAKEGCRVYIPFGKSNKPSLGIIFDLEEAGDDTQGLKYIISVLDTEPVLTGEMLLLTDFVRQRTFCTYFDAVKVMLPSGIGYHIVKKYVPNFEFDISLIENETAKAVFDFLKEKSVPVEEKKLLNEFALKDGKTLKYLADIGAVLPVSSAENNLNEKYTTVYSLSMEFDNSSKLTQKQRAVLDFIGANVSAGADEICSFCGVTKAVITALENKGAVVAHTRIIETEKSCHIDTADIVLTDEQLLAYNSIVSDISRGEYSVSLLYGITGSGKTSVYLKAVDYTLSVKKKVIVLIPEIGLTSRTAEKFFLRYGERVAVFHSALSIRDRSSEWKRVRSGECDIIVGTRSAVFAPVDNIGLIIIDEEQEHTYKSEKTPRYNAVDVAKFRASFNNSLLLLSSATPSVESFALASSGRYKLLKLTKRFGSAGLPQTQVVDMRYAEKVKGCEELSVALYSEIKNALSNKHQVIILINRRGFNTFASCNECSHTMFCPNCSISLTYHSYTGRLICHYCGYSIPYTDICPECGNNTLRYRGYGTQKIEKAIAGLFPGARILRFDADTTSTKNAHQTMLDSFASGEFDILLGTQMVAKGFDFTNVSLVGVVNADSQLYSDDFRCLEKTFSLLTQVVGRCGRGDISGKAVIQTVTPENDIIMKAARQDYDAFFNTEISIRKSSVYPPFCDICVIGLTGADENDVISQSKSVLDMIKTSVKEKYTGQRIIVLGPSPARVSKVSNNYRYRIIIKCRNNPEFREMISALLKAQSSKKVTVFADINPDSIM
ncbi:MAG: primosomal protein N' [Clostridiales bacterium]|nr:primosomal protein N' [Clostridiales bacterium]